MANDASFKISTHLKDIIGRDLVTNEFVAIFELVKNGFDAGATGVDIEFDPEEGTITIADDGHGMSARDIREKWLWVAYSEKAHTGDGTYRDKIKPAGQFAGSKGIGRFSCDTLGEKLELYSSKDTSKKVHRLMVDWTDFEQDDREEFQTIDVDLGDVDAFPEAEHFDMPTEHGTVLVIRKTRHEWDEDSIKNLRADLAKLIDPFGTTDDVQVRTWLVDGTDDAIEGVDGPVGNDIADLLREKTSRIEVRLEAGIIETTLVDRGRTIYETRESSSYDELEGASISGEIYALNRAAKNNFTRRMGVRPVEFGSIFLFLNGFRIFPVGEEMDDTFGLNRRKQQGSSRYFGTRDVLGRVDVTAPPRMFREASSRDAGLIEDARSRGLIDLVRRHMVFRLERYVVGVAWKDKLDQDRETAEGLQNDEARSRILDIVGGLAKGPNVEIIYFDEDIVRVADDPERATAAALNAMTNIAERRGDAALLENVEQARRRIAELKESREEAAREARRAIAERAQADERIARLEQQARFLGRSQDIDVERVQLLMHQAQIYLGHLRSGIDNATRLGKRALENARAGGAVVDLEDFEDLLASIRHPLRELSTELAGANLAGDRLRTVLSFAPNIRVDLETDRVDDDLLTFIAEYVDVRLKGVPGLPKVEFEKGGLSLERRFSPVDIAVIIDNLVDNARKARATKVELKARRRGKGEVAISVVDDGVGIDSTKVDPSKLFERGYSGLEGGTGLGLYTVRTILEQMGGRVALDASDGRADFELILAGEVE